jgi:hypothetical protein
VVNLESTGGTFVQFTPWPTISYVAFAQFECKVSNEDRQANCKIAAIETEKGHERALGNAVLHCVVSNTERGWLCIFVTLSFGRLVTLAIGRLATRTKSGVNTWWSGCVVCSPVCEVQENVNMIMQEA